MLTRSEGETAVHLARKAIEECINNGKKLDPDDLPKIFKEKRGVFVTLHKINGKKELRGCIGRPYPVLQLGEAIILSAINAASEDPRFDPVRPDEIGYLVIEVTILTVPRRIKAKPRDMPDKIIIGKDGLIISKGLNSGLLLPQVAVEHGFDPTEFLCQTCMKAGLMPDAWVNGADVYSFEGQIFEEVRPGGEIKEKDIKSCE